MSTKIGRFEILSELAKSSSGCVYKADDPDSGQTVALKVIHLEGFGDRAETVVQRIRQEAESAKALSSVNLTLVYGAGEIDGQLCAAMEYIQGNSIATMLARKEGFSIWDLLDISRQVCQCLDHAHQHNVFHYSLEPAKIMVTWDGTVKILSFGISSMGLVAAGAEGTPPVALYYMSPEQVRGEALDARSNLFTWGAMLYEMVTDRKPFEGADADAVRQQILEATPTAPAIVNPRISPVASAVIMKAIAKDPGERYQTGREMASDVEKCREATGKAVKKPGEAPKGPAMPSQATAAAAAKFAAPPASNPPASTAHKFETKPPATKLPSGATKSEELDDSWSVPAPPSDPQATKAAAAVAGWNASGSPPSTWTQTLDTNAQFVSSVVKASIDSLEDHGATMSSAVADEHTVEPPKIAVDPLMAEGGGAGNKGVSFSDLAELPPLKEVYIAPPAPQADEAVESALHPSIVLRHSEPEKPKVQPREVAEKAIKEIKGIPPKLLLYSIGAAAALILIIGLAVLWHSHSQNTDEEGEPAPAPAVSTPEPAQTAAPTAQPQASVPEPAPAAPQAESSPEPVQPAEVEEPAPREDARFAPAAKRNSKNKKQAPARAAIPGQLIIDSNPEGAQVQIDGQGEPSWITPYTATALAPGQHTVVVSKAGYGQESRTAEVTSANRSSVMVHLTALVATISVTSNPAGASIFVDSKDTLRVTPSQMTPEKGTHTILVRKLGYLDETTSVTAQPGQTAHFAPTLRPLGNADEIKAVGKFKKLFGAGAAQAGMAKVSVKTNPKGAQIAVNRRLLEKNSPTEFLLNPGNYIVDITLSGYKPVQKVITVDQNGSAVIDETLQPQ